MINLKEFANSKSYIDCLSNVQQFKQFGFTDKEIEKACFDIGIQKENLLTTNKTFSEQPSQHYFLSTPTGNKKLSYSKDRGYTYSYTLYEYENITHAQFQDLQTNKIMYYFICKKIKGFRDLVSPLYKATPHKDLPLEVKYAMWESELKNSHLQCLGNFSGYAEVYLKCETGESLYIPVDALFKKNWEKIVERNISYWRDYNKTSSEKIMETVNSPRAQALKNLLSK